MQDSRMDGLAVELATAMDALANRHYAVIPGFLSPGLLNELRTECLWMHTDGHFHAAGIGRGQWQQHNTAIRGDSIRWLEPDFPAGGQYLARMESVRQALNENLYLGLRSYEAHYARYEAGSYYKRHVDRHRDHDARVISSVCYLNEDWPDEAGGELQVYSAEDERLLISLPPTGGTLILFTSDDLPHEVLPANRVRLSMAGWFRRD